MIEARFIDVLQKLDYRIKDYTCKEKLAEHTIVSSSFKLVISDRVLLLIETKEIYIVESDSVKDKIKKYQLFYNIRIRDYYC